MQLHAQKSHRFLLCIPISYLPVSIREQEISLMYPQTPHTAVEFLDAAIYGVILLGRLFTYLKNSLLTF